MNCSLGPRWRAGESTAGLWLSLGTPAVAELAAESGADAIVLDAQHGLWERATLEWAVRLASPCPVLVRVARNRPELIGAALDAGAEGVIVPLVETAAEAAAAVAASRYPPDGERSGGGIRPLRDMKGYVERSRSGTLVCVMIETAAGLANAAAIAATPGIDMVFIGAGDLSLSIGDDGAALEHALETIRAACAAAGVPCGIYTPHAEAARARARQGFRFVIAGDDVGLLRQGFAAARAAFVKKEESAHG